VLQDNAFGAVD